MLTLSYMYARIRICTHALIAQSLFLKCGTAIAIARPMPHTWYGVCISKNHATMHEHAQMPTHSHHVRACRQTRTMWVYYLPLRLLYASISLEK
jgi:hypothetical protein